jgi:hypothetical protein
MHLDEDQVQRLLHGELGSSSEAARAHLAACVACRERVAVAQREEADVFGLLTAVDDPVPSVDAAVIQKRARAPDARRLSWAAGIVLALGIAGVAYAAPGSPVQRWVTALVGRLRSGPGVTQQAPPTRASPLGMAGVAVDPGHNLLIAFTSTQTAGDVLVRMTDSTQVVVRAPSGSATFSSDADRLVIDNGAGSGTFEIDLPRSAPRVEISVRGMRRFLKEGHRVTGNTRPDAAGVYAIPLVEGIP